MTDKEHVTLTLGFDVDRVADTLSYLYVGDGKTPTNPLTGMFSGEIYFCRGGKLKVLILGGGAIAGYEDFLVVDCCFVSKPKMIAGPDGTLRYAAPSPFMRPEGATHRLQNDFSSRTDDVDKYRIVTKTWQNELEIGYVDGRWEMSVILTVKIWRGGGREPDLRVFSFDPEGQVGPGTSRD